MKKILRTRIIFLVLFNFCIGIFAQEQRIYVSSSGNDSNSGQSAELALATLQEAIDRWEAFPKSFKNSETAIVLDSGRYNFTKPVIINNSIGQRGHLSILPLESGKVVFDGSQRINGWKKYKKNIWMAKVPGVAEGKWNFRQLFVNGKRKTIARFPNEGYYYVTGFPDGGGEVDYHKESQRFQFREGDISPDWVNRDDIRVIVYHFWSDAHLIIRDIDKKNNIVTFKYPAEKRFTDDFTNDGAKYIVENVFEGLDRQGEWYLDRSKGIIYYIPEPGEDPLKMEAVAPFSGSFLRIEGKSGTEPVENISISGINFIYSNFSLSEGDQNDLQGCSTIPASVSMKYSKGIEIKNCTFRNLGNFGIDIQMGCYGIDISGNLMSHLAAGAIKINGGTGEDAHLNRTEKIHIFNNEIGYYGDEYPSAVGILLMHASGCYIGHNNIHHGWYTGVSLGWNWGYDRSISRDNIVEFNHIHHIGQGLLSDMGGIYTLGVSPGTIIRNNLIHDVDANKYGGWGIYNDEGSSYILIENNIVYNTKYAAYNIHYAKELTVQNNIFALGKLEVLSRGRTEPHTSVYFERNIIYWDSLKDPFSVNWKDEPYSFYVSPSEKSRTMSSTFVSDYNLFYCSDTESDSLRFFGATFADWRGRGKDKHSIIADPLFEDAESFDFRLKPGSPAYRLGFRDIDMSDLGPTEK